MGRDARTAAESAPPDPTAPLVPVRILHVIGWLAPRYGGTSEVVRQYYRALSARGHVVDIVTTNVDGPGVLDVVTGQPIVFGDVTATFHPLAHPRRFLTSWSLLSDLRGRVSTYDVVHIHSLYRFHTIAAAATARREHVPYLLQAHGSLNPPARTRRRRLKDGYHRLVEDSNIDGAAALLCTSDDEQRAIHDLGYRPPTVVIPLGVDAEDLRAPVDTNGFRAGLGIDPATPIVSFLGRIWRGKGVELLVRAVATVSASRPDIHLVLAGPDDLGLARTLRNDPDLAHLASRISWTGTIGGADKRALLQTSAVVALPSTSESFGLAIAEAMAVGCPVVVSPGVPLRETVRRAGAGLVVDREVDAIAMALEQIIADPDAAARMGAAGRRAIDERFTWATIGAELERVYESIEAGTNNG